MLDSTPQGPKHSHLRSTGSQKIKQSSTTRYPNKQQSPKKTNRYKDPPGRPKPTKPYLRLTGACRYNLGLTVFYFLGISMILLPYLFLISFHTFLKKKYFSHFDTKLPNFPQNINHLNEHKLNKTFNNSEEKNKEIKLAIWGP